MYTDNTDMNKNEVTFPKNSAIIQMSNKISAVQRKSLNTLIYYAQKQLNEHSPIDYAFKINADTILKTIGLGEKNHEYLKRYLEELQNIKVTYNILNKDKKRKWGSFVILAGFEYESGSITYSFPHQILNAIIDPKIYAYIDLVIIKGLKSKYAISLYELSQDYKKTGTTPKMTISKFKELIGVNKDKYKKNIPMLRKAVLEQACKELNSNSKINFLVDYKLFKTGKKYTDIRFFIKPKKQQRQQVKQQLENQKIGLLLAELPADHRTKSAEKLLEKYREKGVEYIRAQIKFTSNANPRNYLAYLSEALKNDYAGAEKSSLAEEIAKQEQERREQAEREAIEKRKAEEAKKRAAEEEEKEWEQKWEQLPAEEQEKYLAAVKEKSATARTHENIAKQLAIALFMQENYQSNNL